MPEGHTLRKLADDLAAAFAGCDVVAHCAGINREIGDQTFQRVHVDGTRAVVEAAHRAGVQRIVMVSFLRARPDCGSGYHESKWEAEEIIRHSGIDHTILKSGMIYGRGDHMVDHVARAARTVPFFWTVGFRERRARPVPVDDAVDVRRRDRLALVRHAHAVLDPLPQLHARDLRRRGVLHEPVQRDAAVPAEPCRAVGERSRDVFADTGGRDLAWRLGTQ